MEWNETTTGTTSETSGIGSTGTIDDAKEKARQAAGDAQRKVSQELRSRADSARTQAADALGSVARALTSSAQQLENESQGVPVEYVQRAGDQIRRASDYLRSRNTDEIIRSAEDFARKQPAVFLGGAFVLGFLAARLVKSSQSPPYGGTVPHDRSLVPRTSMWNSDREAPVSEFREPL